MALAANRPPVRTAIGYSCDAAEAKICADADTTGLDPALFELVPVEPSHAATEFDTLHALSRDLSDQGMIAYGYHGLSYPASHITLANDELAIVEGVLTWLGHALEGG